MLLSQIITNSFKKASVHKSWLHISLWKDWNLLVTFVLRFYVPTELHDINYMTLLVRVILAIQHIAANDVIFILTEVLFELMIKTEKEMKILLFDSRTFSCFHNIKLTSYVLMYKSCKC